VYYRRSDFCASGCRQPLQVQVGPQLQTLAALARSRWPSRGILAAARAIRTGAGRASTNVQL